MVHKGELQSCYYYRYCYHREGCSAVTVLGLPQWGWGVFCSRGALRAIPAKHLSWDRSMFGNICTLVQCCACHRLQKYPRPAREMFDPLSMIVRE